MADRTKLAAGLAAGTLIAAWYRRHRRRDPWEAMLDKALPAIVVIRVNYVKPFDGEQAGSGSATGFVVDFERGLILTNRHVIGTGPIRAEATFVNKEEVPLTPVYRDPVHDFGLFHFDVTKLRYADELQRAEIPLAEDGAKVGLEIRVVGNDSGEKIQILAGTLARLDRNAPLYGGDGFNDFNTFYYSAASNTSGGSSGSPVLDSRGRAVALNAGGCNASASSYYLPLHAVVRALDALKRFETPQRGTLRVVWRHVTCDEARRLALSPAAEALLRRHHHGDDTCGLLCVDQVITGGSGSAAGLEPGDLLLSCGDKRFPDFDALESYLDANAHPGVPFLWRLHTMNRLQE
jgi:S1-C subfamily serine protease